jgi:hypothetical protein
VASDNGLMVVGKAVLPELAAVTAHPPEGEHMSVTQAVITYCEP